MIYVLYIFLVDHFFYLFYSHHLTEPKTQDSISQVIKTTTSLSICKQLSEHFEFPLQALALAGMALVLAAIVGLKKHSHDDHDDHQVIYAGHHGHHRRRRDVPLDTPLPYQGWAQYNQQSH